MAPLARQIDFMAGGDVLAKYGTLLWRKAPPTAGGEIPYTFTRSGSGLFVANDVVAGGLQYFTAPANTPRVDQQPDPVTGQLQNYLVVELLGTNSYLRSEEFDNASWNTKSNMTVTANSALAPDGTTTADTFVESTDGAPTLHYIKQTLPALTDNTNQCASIHVRPGSRSWLLMEAQAKNAVFYDASFNLSGAGSVGTVSSGARGIIVAKFSLTDGTIYYRCCIVFPSNSGATTPNVAHYPATGDGGAAATYQGNGSNSLYMWGAQFDKDQNFPSSYIKTVASTATRNAETFTVPWYAGPTGGEWLYARFLERGAGLTPAAYPELVRIGTASTRPQFRFVGTYANPIAWQYSADYQLTAGDASEAAATAGAGAFGNVIELLAWVNLAKSLLTFRWAINGGAESVGTAAPAAGTPANWSGLQLALGGNAAYSRVLHGYGGGTALSTIADVRNLL